MIVPWGLILRLVAGVLVGAAALRLRGARRERMGAAVDLALTLVIGAVVGGRLAVLALDTALIGSLPDLRAVLGLGPGLSTPGALVGATLAGWRRRPRPDLQVWQDAGLSILAGMAAFAVLHLPATPIANSVRALALTAAAVWLTRADPTRWHPAFRLLATVAGVHLAAAALTPSLATVDADVDLLLTLVILLACLLTPQRVSAGTRQLGGVVGAVVGALALVVALTGATAPPLPVDAGPATTASVDGAIRAGGTSTDVPAWGPDELAALVRDTDLPIVVNLWASWCPPCHAEAATVARAAEALQGQAIVLGVLVDDEVADGQGFADRYGLSFPTVVDDGLSDGLGMVGLPTTVILDRDGAVVRRVVGGLSQGTLAEAVEAAARR